MKIYLALLLLILAGFGAGVFAGVIVHERSERAFHRVVLRA